MCGDMGRWVRPKLPEGDGDVDGKEIARDGCEEEREHEEENVDEDSVDHLAQQKKRGRYNKKKWGRHNKEIGVGMTQK
jgi:hypothetical protein